ncbi:SPFH domain-containing protein [Sphingobium sp. CAP-1]|uniref:SPFH domain-containing protein n=1 Tax=Sphingobium sp. CAP-1 TaxID=2676077 RepID=UPI0012BB3797|nr:SPFH domain-containing protein [Sphingobium sp. CAP-1]QGP80029.1 hypothetical protein GL174_14310 [Sphingobium sp. CAP-1]
MKIKTVITASLLVLSLSACTRVDPGHVGVKVNRYGSSAGVEAKALGVGTYQTMFGVDIYEYPIYTNNFTWGRTAKDADGNELPNNEMAFQDKNGLIVTGDVAVAYRVDPIRAPILFQKYRTDMDGIVAGRRSANSAPRMACRSIRRILSTTCSSACATTGTSAGSNWIATRWA